MTKNLLVELGLEELPAYVVTPSEKQLGKRMAAFLNDKRLAFDSIQTFSTPRRLAVRVTGLADAQTDLTEDFKGPSKKIALDADGQFTKAAQGFVRGKGLTTEDIEFREVKGEEYVYVTKHEAGKSAEEVLKDLPEILAAMTFPVNMHWANNTFEYIRPVHTLTVLLDDEDLDLDFLDIHSGRVSRGHRFLGHEVEIANADSYEDDLRQVFVIADAKERQDMIVNQIKAIEKAIMTSDIGITPSNDGSVIRLVFPELTEERRKDLVKEVKKKAEEAKVAVRNIRREGNDAFKKLGKEDVSEDEIKSLEEDLQKLTDKYIKNVDALMEEKSKEIMTV